MTTNVGSANLFASSGAKSKMKLVGAIAAIIVTIWATAAPASAGSTGSRQKADKAASMTCKGRVADPVSESCCYVMPLVLGTGF